MGKPKTVLGLPRDAAGDVDTGRLRANRYYRRRDDGSVWYWTGEEMVDIRHKRETSDLVVANGELDRGLLVKGEIYKVEDGRHFQLGADGETFREVRRLDEPDEHGRIFAPIPNERASSRTADWAMPDAVSGSVRSEADAIAEHARVVSDRAGRGGYQATVIGTRAREIAETRQLLADARYVAAKIGIDEKDYPKIAHLEERHQKEMAHLHDLQGQLLDTTSGKSFSADDWPQLGLKGLIKQWNREVGTQISGMDEQHRVAFEISRKELAELESEAAGLNKLQSTRGLSQEQVSRRDRLVRRVEKLRGNINDGDRVHLAKRAEAQKYNKRWDNLVQTALENFPIDPESGEVLLGGFTGLYQEFDNAGDLEDLAGNVASLANSREGRDKLLDAPRRSNGHPGLRDDSWEEGYGKNRIRMQEQLLAETEGEIRKNINTIAENIVKQGQLPRTAVGWLAEQAVKSDDPGKFTEFLVTDPEAVIVHFAATNGLRELSGWLAGIVAGTAAGVATTNVGAGVETAALVNEAVDKAIGALAAVAFAENEALIDLLQANDVPLKDRGAVAAFIDKNIDAVVAEIKSAEFNALEDELIESFLGFKIKNPITRESTR